MEESYEMINQSDFSTYRSEKESSGEVYVSPGLRYTDGTMKIFLRPVENSDTDNETRTETSEEWEANRQRYLREATNGEKALEGVLYGYLHFDGKNDFPSPYLDSVFYQEEENEIDEWRCMGLDDLYEVLKKMPIRKSEKTRKEEWQSSKVKKWQREWENPEIFSRTEEAGPPVRRDFSGELHGYTRIPAVWEEPRVRSVDGLIKKLSEIGFLFRTQNLSEEDKWDYSGHAFGLFNTGCCEFDVNSGRFVLDSEKALSYVEEHFSRRLMSADVALEFMRKTGAISRKRNYLDWSKEQKENYVEENLGKAIEEVSRRKKEEKRRKEKEKQEIKNTFPEIFSVFGDCRVWVDGEWF